MKRGINLCKFYKQAANASIHSRKCLLSTTGVCLQPKENRKYGRENLKIKDFFGDQTNKYEDTFGDIDQFEMKFQRLPEDPDDVKEYMRQKAAQGKSIKQYLKEIHTHLKNHDYESALKTLEVDMVNDRKRVVPHIYDMLICYNGNKGNLPEAYRLYLQYKKRQGFVTGAMYTSLFNACANHKNSFEALEKANTIRECLMNDKNHKVNTTNYNAMLKAYGRHADLETAFKIFDEVLERRDKVRAPTYAFLLSACISDKNSGLRHALIFWRKMLQNGVMPSIYLFDLMLRCINECSLGEATLINNLIDTIQAESQVFYIRKVKMKTTLKGTERKVLKIPTDRSNMISSTEVPTNESENVSGVRTLEDIDKSITDEESGNKMVLKSDLEEQLEGDENSSPDESELNLLALKPSLGSVISFKSMTSPQDRFKCVGGKNGFLKVMKEFKVKPTVKTFTLMLDLLPSTQEAEEDLIKEASIHEVKLDTIFCNRLLQRRIYRDECDLIPQTLKLMQDAGEKPDIVTFGVLATSCRTHESGKELIEKTRKFGYRLNNEIIGALLNNAKDARDLNYLKDILQAAKEDNVVFEAKNLIRVRKFLAEARSLKEMQEKEEEIEKVEST